MHVLGYVPKVEPFVSPYVGAFHTQFGSHFVALEGGGSTTLRHSAPQITYGTFPI